MLDSTLIETKCGLMGSSLADHTEFTSADENWINTCLCPASTDTGGNPGIIYFDPTIGRNGNSCPTFDCGSNEGNHQCTQGDDPITNTRYAIFCKY
jgi:hypothetical protein